MFRIRPALVVMLAVLGGSRGYAQTILPLPQQVATPTYAPQEFHAGPAACSPNEDNNGRTLWGDPLLEGKQIAENVFAPGPYTPGWFFALEASLVNPHVRQEMFNFVGPFQTLPGFHIANTDLSWNVMPVVQLGYRLEQGAGEFLCTYQYLNSSGSSSGIDASGNPASISSHLSINSFDVLYATREFSLGPWCDMKWLMGVRIGDIFFDTQSGSILGQQAISNNFVGGGPVLGLNLAKAFKGTGLDIFCRIEGAFLYGPTSQFFNAGGGATVNEQHNSFVPVPKVEAGVGWSPVSLPRLHLATGYTFQFWDGVAEESPRNGSLSRGDVTIQGIFFRGEWNF